MLKRFGLIIIALMLANLPNRIEQAAAGDLDPSFGLGGIVKTDLSDSFDPVSNDFLNAVVLQSDGKIVATGLSCCHSAGLQFTVVRYTSDGRLDTSFGTGGVTTTDFRQGRNYEGAESQALTLQPDGKIIVVGRFLDLVTGSHIALARYNPDGSLDTGFGNGGKVATELSINGILMTQDASAVALQQDGKIIVVGSTFYLFGSRRGNVFVVLRYDADGSLDQSFGTGGFVTTDFSGGNPDCDDDLCSDQASAVAVQPDGKIIVVGREWFNPNWAVARYNSDGSLDQSFGSKGRQVFTISSPLHETGAVAVALQPNGKILVAGNAEVTSLDIGLVRLNPDGSFDPTFGNGGKVQTDYQGRADVATSMALQPDGKIVVAGYTFIGSSAQSHTLLVRYNPDGSLDGTFGSGGIRYTEFSNLDERFNSVTIQKDGKLIAAGFLLVASAQGVGYDFLLARFLGQSFDLCVQDDGSGNLLQVNTTTGEYQFTNCAGLTIEGTGILTKRGSLITLQHNASDRRVMATIDTSTNKATASVQLFSQGRTFTITDRNIRNNTCACK
jgi:uncharacterized delta-60 repeat protein